MNKIYSIIFVLLVTSLVFVNIFIPIKIASSLITFLIFPGFFICSSSKLKNVLPNNYLNFPIYFVLSISLFMPLFLISNFLEINWNDFLVYFELNFLLYFLVFAIKGDPNLKLNIKKIYIPFLILFLIILVGNHYLDIYEDSIYHLFRINFLKNSNILTNFSYTSSDFVIKSASELNPNYHSRSVIGWPTYDFAFYFSLITSLIKLTKSSTYTFVFIYNKFLYIILMLSFLLLGSSLLKSRLFNKILFSTVLVSQIGLKNFYNVSKLGKPAFSINSLFHPTNIASFIFFPVLMYWIVKHIQSGHWRKQNKYSLMYFFIILVSGFLIHKILIVLIIPFVFLFSILDFQQNKKVNSFKIWIPVALVSLIYTCYYFLIPKIYNNSLLTTSSLTESRAREISHYSSVFDFILKYGIYIENTFYKLFYFPITFSILLLLPIYFSKRVVKYRIFTFTATALIGFSLLLLPGSNVIIVKFLRAFIQRVFTSLNAEILISFLIFFVIRKFKLKSMKVLFSFVAIFLICTLVLDLNRKGNYKLIYQPERMDFIEFVENNSHQGQFLADLSSEHELNSNCNCTSMTFNPNQSNITRSGADKYNFHLKLNRFLYWGENSDEFNTLINRLNIKYIVLSKKDYFDGSFENFNTPIYNVDFKDIYLKRNAIIAFEDRLHVIYRL